MKKLVLLLAVISMNANAFYTRCSGPNDMEVLISASTRDVSETNTGLYIEEAHMDFKESKNSGYKSGWGEFKVENGLTIFNGDRINFSYKAYNPVEGDQNSLRIDGELVFENISLSCSGKM